ncbi:hypothetical protein [Brevundimonas diminuta]|uniref:hypothetical protein n=1 Tax=Brevundimonas diminuta TaxID=293 RepID=UPI001F570434|nr:hypothetical protein [Brevundimonas diminuta]
MEIDIGLDDGLRLEVDIFPHDHVWLGLQFNGGLEDAAPVWKTIDGKDVPLLSVCDDGTRWWVAATDWDVEAKRHHNLLSRSLGSFRIEGSGVVLDVVVVLHERGRVVLEDYLRDFQDDLLWLALGFDGAGAVDAPDKPLVAALDAFAAAAAGIARSPATVVRERIAEARAGRLRPNAATFRRHARDPEASRLPGRLAEECADTPDNRFLRYMAGVCLSLARGLGGTAGRQANVLERRAVTESLRAAAFSRLEPRRVDPGVFDNQLAELETGLADVRRSVGEVQSVTNAPEGRFPIRIGNGFGKKPGHYFYDRLGDQPSGGVDFRVMCIPPAVESAILAVRHFCRDFTFSGSAESSVKKTSNDRPYRFLDLSRIAKVEPDTTAVDNKRLKRDGLARNGWLAPLSSRERLEALAASRTAERRGAVLKTMADRTNRLAAALDRCASTLVRTEAELARRGVGRDAQMPTGVRYSMHPGYASCLSAFRMVETLARGDGLGTSALDAVDRVGTLHASALYERWCLVKILAVLVDDYRFEAERDWKERLISAVTGAPEPFALRLYRPDIELGAVLEIQPLLKNGRRPDFRLRFAHVARDALGADDGARAEFDLCLFDGVTGLVADAKFRTRWRAGELSDIAAALVREKRYDQEGDRVFVLHPVPTAMSRPTSPLDWGPHCDYGHNRGENHRSGTVLLAPAAGEGDARKHLRRLIGLELQARFPKPEPVAWDVSPRLEFEIAATDRSESCPRTRGSGRAQASEDACSCRQTGWSSASFCLACGEKHAVGRITATCTSAGQRYWTFSCEACGFQTKRTHCYGCSAVLFKNSLEYTYHRTAADQITNVICPDCGKYFDEEWAAASQS